jgi:hypothetical protein
MHDDHHNGYDCEGGVVETIQVPTAPLSEGERLPLRTLTADPQLCWTAVTHERIWRLPREAENAQVEGDKLYLARANVRHQGI